MDFDELLDRRATGAEKWNPAQLEGIYGTSDVLPLWVADMDFRSPAAAGAYLHARADVDEFGYEIEPPQVRPTIANWYATRHGWPLDPEHLTATHGVVNVLGAAVQLYTEPGDGVIIQPPVFFYFALTVRRNERKLVNNALRLVDGRYEMDFEDLEAKAADPRNKLLILCNPHNPVARVWTADELRRVDETCRRHGVHVVSDEIHGDIVYPGHVYTPYARVAEDATTALSPAKTFNVAGITGAFAHIADDTARQRFKEFQRRLGLMKKNALEQGVTEAVYRDGAEWVDALMGYLGRNVAYVRERLDQIEGVELIEPDGTYLMWLDFRALGFDRKQLGTFLVERARLGLNAGSVFGREGAGFARMCIACPGRTLEEAFDRLERAVED